jgi:hypothetical protein
VLLCGFAIALVNTIHDRCYVSSIPRLGLPGWNRLSVGLHLDNFRRFYEDSDSGQDYETCGLLTEISFGGSIGSGYESALDNTIFTYDGVRLPNAFNGVYTPRGKYSAYAVIGIEGQNVFEVNFETGMFKWKEGNVSINDRAWRVGG